jgi:hypothetical protein
MEADLRDGGPLTGAENSDVPLPWRKSRIAKEYKVFRTLSASGREAVVFPTQGLLSPLSLIEARAALPAKTATPPPAKTRQSPR